MNNNSSNKSKKITLPMALEKPKYRIGITFRKFIFLRKLNNDRYILFTILALLIFFIIFTIKYISPTKPNNINLVSPTTRPSISKSLPSIAFTPSPTDIILTNAKQKAIVKRVIDGDTIELDNKMIVRYIGINSPESVDPRRKIECFGKEASEYNKNLVLGKTVYLEKDVSEKDKYGRLLRYVYIDDIMVNEYLIQEGYAQSSSYPPDIKYQDLFLTAQKDAIEKRRGLWGDKCGYYDKYDKNEK